MRRPSSPVCRRGAVTNAPRVRTQPAYFMEAAVAWHSSEQSE